MFVQELSISNAVPAKAAKAAQRWIIANQIYMPGKNASLFRPLCMTL